MPDQPLELILLWHMHQPDYRDHVTGELLEPWTYLHALKDYADMAGHLERHPTVRAVVNFTPVLIDQIEALVADLRAETSRDPLVRLLLLPDLDRATEEERIWLLEHCFRCNHPTMLTPFTGYAELWRIWQTFEGDTVRAARYLSGAYFADLVTWYHLAWTGETVRRGHPFVRELIKRQSAFNAADRRTLFGVIRDTLASLLPRYRQLAAAGRIELSSTPYAHPLAPLMLDFGSVREVLPSAGQPEHPAYPGGAQRVSSQVDEALVRHAQVFGQRPAGMWPAEGALSDPFLGQLAQAGLGWTMSGEAVLMHSLKVHGTDPAAREASLAHAYRFSAGSECAVFFRDDELSDLIGFEYARWHGKAAAGDLVARLERRREQLAGGEEAMARPMVVIALDGENAWEHYPYNGFYFFDELYGALTRHPLITTTTPAAFLARPDVVTRELPHLVAGSWVYGNLSTWMGDPVKNSAWDRLCRAKAAYDALAATAEWSAQQRALIELQLARAESSDWFWWLGEGADGHGPRTFDYLARRNLANLYRLIGVAPPEELERAVVGDLPAVDTAPTIGSMRRST